MTAAQRAHALSLLKNQPHLGNRAIARMVGRGMSDNAVDALRKQSGVTRNKRKGVS